MLQGAIIGAVVAMIAVLVIMLRNQSRLGKVATPLKAGDKAGARAALDRLNPKNALITSASAGAKARERLAGLALIEDGATIAAEVSALTGPDKQVTYAKNVGFLALALVGDRPAEAVASLEALLKAAEAARHGRIQLEVLRAQLAVAKAMQGEPLDPKALRTFKQNHLDKGIVEELARRCIARATAQPVSAAA